MGSSDEPYRTDIVSSDPALLERATRTAEAFAGRYRVPGVAGICFLGSVARGYSDRHADIDVALFTEAGFDAASVPLFQHVGGFEVHCHVSRLADETSAAWDTARRWTYSECRIFHDPDGRIAELLRDKVPLRHEERRWLLISGITLAEWYANRLNALWVERGSIASAHGMFARGLDHFYDALFSLNDRLVADHKWRSFSAERLSVLPSGFRARMEDVTLVLALTVDDLARRREAFMAMWRELLPLVERDVGMAYEEFKNTV
jgi:hypothetical protein